MDRTSSRRFSLGILVALAGLAAAACSSGGSPSPSAGGANASASAGGNTVDVTLSEWSVVPTPGSVAAGATTFKVTNNGPDDVHEFVVIKTDLPFNELPTDDTGAVDEAGGDMEVVDEIEDIPVGETQELNVTLEPGAYVLLCNIYSESEQEAHYQEGMRIPFTVS